MVIMIRLSEGMVSFTGNIKQIRERSNNLLTNQRQIQMVNSYTSSIKLIICKCACTRREKCSTTNYLMIEALLMNTNVSSLKQ